MYDNKQLVNGEYLHPDTNCYQTFYMEVVVHEYCCQCTNMFCNVETLNNLKLPYSMDLSLI